MKSHGIIYQAPGRGRSFFYHLMRSLGAGLVAFAIVALIFSFYPILKEELTYKPQKIGFGDLMGRSQASDFGLDPYFSLYIPKINARAKIIPNVDAGNQTAYLNALTEGVAHAKGTNFPGQGKLIYFFSHSTDSPLNFARYNAVFFLLRKLEKGDRVIVFFMGQKHEYVVTDKYVTAPSDTSSITDSGRGEELVLQTCDPPGTSLRRLIVVGVPY